VQKSQICFLLLGFFLGVVIRQLYQDQRFATGLFCTRGYENSKLQANGFHVICLIYSLLMVLQELFMQGMQNAGFFTANIKQQLEVCHVHF
jgi:hypothetical protein